MPAYFGMKMLLFSICRAYINYTLSLVLCLFLILLNNDLIAIVNDIHISKKGVQGTTFQNNNPALPTPNIVFRKVSLFQQIIPIK